MNLRTISDNYAARRPVDSRGNPQLNDAMFERRKEIRRIYSSNDTVMQSSEKLQRGTGCNLKLGPGVLYGSIGKMLEAIEETADHPNLHLHNERWRY